jgi:alpha-L-rhamnosidase
MPSRLLLVLAFLSWPLFARPVVPPTPPPPESRLLEFRWDAHWIAHPETSGYDYEVLLFRRTFALEQVPEAFRVHVSADNRYRLWVNGRSIHTGPQRDDLTHWRYDTLDLAPHLQVGDNLLAVQVWNYGRHRPLALMSLETGLIVQGATAAEAVVNTGAGWKVMLHPGLRPVPIDRGVLQTYIVVGPGDRLDAAKTPWGWQEPRFDDRDWKSPRQNGPGVPHGFGVNIGRWLAPRNLPLIEETPQPGLRLRRSEGISAQETFLTGQGPLHIPPRRQARLLLDQTHLTTAYPELTTSGGRGSTLTLTYAEALIDADRQKGNRDEIDGKTMIGLQDVFRPDGGRGRLFTPLDYRTFRYLELLIETGDEPLTIDDLQSRFTAYPFVERARFESDDPRLHDIWTVGWRTARLCAYETYIDCPYYEQLQYLGDTRIQALISMYVSGDDRLARQAIDIFDRSRWPDGLTQSRYPSSEPQIINAFSLFWVGMVHDYHLLRDDPAFIRERLVGVRAVLDWFHRQVDPNSGLLGPLPYWSFVDWADEWPWDPMEDRGGEPPGALTGGSAILTLQYAQALREAAVVFADHGDQAPAAAYRRQADDLVAAVRRQCWNSQRRLFSDTPGGKSFSQHTNTFAVLTGAVPAEEAAEFMSRVMADQQLVQATLYFRFYTLRALKKAGLGEQYLDFLQPWHDMLALGLTTFAERPDPTRSDCHAWSSSPVYEFLATVAGIEPAAPGFKSVRIAPHLGYLKQVDAEMPHPAGIIAVQLQREGHRIHGIVTLPDGLAGTFEWRGQHVNLRPGRQAVEISR